jgi:hypothetical protein
MEPATSAAIAVKQQPVPGIIGTPAVIGVLAIMLIGFVVPVPLLVM